jgi:hypothetical protein
MLDLIKPERRSSHRWFYPEESFAWVEFQHPTVSELDLVTRTLSRTGGE